MADIKRYPLKKSPSIREGWVYNLMVFPDRLEFKHRGKRMVTRDPRLINKALTILAEVFLS